MSSKALLLVTMACTAFAMPMLGPTPIRAETSVQRVNPRPRLLFAPGEYDRFVSETTGSRQAAFDRLLDFIQGQGTKAWNERDLQLESQAIVARVLIDRGDPRGQTVLGYARNSLRFFLRSHTYTNWSDSHDIVTEGGRWLEAVALAHDWLHREWTPDERASIAGWLDAEVNDWVGKNRMVRASSSPFRNDAARGTSALFLVGLTLFDEPDSGTTARQALAYAQPFYDAILNAHQYAGLGGGLTEGTFYGNFTAWAQVLTAEALFTATGDREAYTRTPFYQARLRYATHAAWPGYLTNQFSFSVHQLAPVFGDARRGPTGSALYHRAVVLLLGKRFPNTEAAREAYWAVNRPETSRTYTPEWGLYDLLFWSPSIEPTQPTALSYREPSLGQVFARSDWTDGATWMSFNAGPHLDSHQHYDAGNLTIFRHVDLLVDSGSFDAFASAHWFNYYARTVAHNTITVIDPAERWAGINGSVPTNLTANDGGQRTAAPLTPAPSLDEYLASRDAYDQARITRFSAADWGTYTRADLTNAYQNPRFQSARPDGTRNRPKVTAVQRDVVYLRRSAGRRDAFVVMDRVTAADPSFKKAVLWHSRERFDSDVTGTQVDAGETRYESSSRYNFSSFVRFNQGKLQGAGRLFVTVLPIDPVIVRQIGLRIPTDEPDHVTFGVPHFHRHVKDYYVEDPRDIRNPDRTTGAFGRTEWPPFNPPEQQWLFRDDLVGGWGQTRLQVEPNRARATDRFLTVLVPADADESTPPVVSRAASSDGQSFAAVIKDGDSTDVVVVGAGDGDLGFADITVPYSTSSGRLIATSLTPGGRYMVRAVVSGTSLQIVLAAFAAGAASADDGGMLVIPFNAVQRASSVSVLAAETGLPAMAAAAGLQGARGNVIAGAQAGGGTSGGANQGGSARPHPGLVTFSATEPPVRDQWDVRVARMIKAGELKLRESTEDALVPGRTHQRYTQMYKGVPVFGGDVTRQLEDRQTVSLFGTIYERIALDPVPKLTTAEATSVLEKLSGSNLGPSRAPELIVLPMDDGTYRLTYRARVATANDVMMYFIDANTGETVLSFSDLKRPVL